MAAKKSAKADAKKKPVKRDGSQTILSAAQGAKNGKLSAHRRVIDLGGIGR